MPAYDDEIFGPVASVIRAKDDEDAMRIANDSRYGLGGGIFSKDTERATEMAKKHFDTGMVRINSFGAAHPNMPFGGVRTRAMAASMAALACVSSSTSRNLAGLIQPPSPLPE